MLERLLIVGLGSIGARHARLARELLPNLEITVLRHGRCPEKNEPSIDYCVNSLSDALRRNPQAAVISNPATLHLEAAIPLARAGVHLLVEKPIAEAAHGVAELIELCRAHRLVLMTGYNLRFLPSLLKFRELLREDRVGRILSVRSEIGQYLPAWRPSSDYRQTVSAKAALGGGVLLELSHDIDYLHWLFGEVQWVSAIHRKQSHLEIDVEDLAYLTLGFEGADQATSLVASLNMDLLRHDATRCCTVIGDKGSLRWNALTGTVDVFEPGAHAWQPVFLHQHQRDESYLTQWRHFLNCISGDETPLVSGYDGLSVLRIVEAARRSSTSGAIEMVNNSSNGLLRTKEKA
jgi:predicted dehydrogenase